MVQGFHSGFSTFGCEQVTEPLWASLSHLLNVNNKVPVSLGCLENYMLYKVLRRAPDI